MRSALALCVCLLGAAGAATAQQPEQSRRDAERRLQQVRGELKSVAAERRRLEAERGAASRQLRQADEQVDGVQRALRQTQDSLQRDAQALVALRAERARHSGDIDLRRRELAVLLRAAQAAGPDAPLKTMLAQDRIADAQRALAYQDYLQRARVARIRALAAEVQRIEALERGIGERREAMARDTRRQAAQLAELESARRQRAGVLAGIDRQYRDRATREQALGRDARALQSLLAQLRASAARAAREAERARAAASRPQGATARAPAPRAAARPAPLRVGGLGWPVAGNLLAAFGGRLPDGRRSDGVLVAAAAGTPVRAVADGTVVFADWMTGYGMILIVDHGNGYMSLYAHNDGLLKEAGDAVKRGDAVASVGTSGGQAQPALYFELRRNGAPMNPAGWLGRQ